MSEDKNLEGVEATPEVPETSNEESLEVNEPDNGKDNSTPEGDESKNRRTERADFFKRKEELEKEYEEKFKKLESEKVDYQEGEEGSKRPIASDDVDMLKRDLAEVTLKQEGVTHEDDIQQVLDIADKMGTSPKDVVSLTWVQAMLKDNASVRRNTSATPSTSKRSGQKSVRDSVAYWINRTDLPPKEQKDLRRQVIHARRDAQNKTQMFNN